MRGHAADRRLEADKTGVAGGAADRSAAVRPYRGGHETRRDARCGAAARAARRQIGVPGIAGHAEKVVAGVALEGEFRHISLADHDRARRAQARDRQFVDRGHEPRERPAAPGRRQARDVDVVLDRDRHAFERRARARPCDKRASLWRAASAAPDSSSATKALKRPSRRRMRLSECSTSAVEVSWPSRSAAAMSVTVSGMRSLINPIAAVGRSPPASGRTVRARQARRAR